MRRRQFISDLLKQVCAGAGACSFSGCGTLMHAERIGQPSSHNIDWKIAALDGLGLLLFFIPGVIAFVVDFSTGAIYLPPEDSHAGYGANTGGPAGVDPRNTRLTTATTSNLASSVAPVACLRQRREGKAPGLKCVPLARAQLQRQPLEQVVSAHVGYEVSFDAAATRLSELERIEQFDDQLTRHRSDHSFGHSVRSFFSGMKNS
jgi:hypothetical protein